MATKTGSSPSKPIFVTSPSQKIFFGKKNIGDYSKLVLGLVVLCHKSAMVFKLLFFLLIQSSFAQSISLEGAKAVASEIEAVYGPMATKEGRELKISWFLDSPITNASGYPKDQFWMVNIHGGLLKSPAMTIEGFRLILCHEIGHIIGGEPVFGITSNAGQPDYYATMVCMKLLLSDKDNSAYSPEKVDRILNRKCVSQFHDKRSQDICRRTGSAASELTKFLAPFYPRLELASYQRPSPEVVSTMQAGHPDPQCRLDTLLAGSLCKVMPSGSSAREADAMNILCDEFPSSRPSCWFVR